METKYDLVNGRIVIYDRGTRSEYDYESLKFEQQFRQKHPEWYDAHDREIIQGALKFYDSPAGGRNAK